MRRREQRLGGLGRSRRRCGPEPGIELRCHGAAPCSELEEEQVAGGDRQARRASRAAPIARKRANEIGWPLRSSTPAGGDVRGCGDRWWRCRRSRRRARAPTSWLSSKSCAGLELVDDRDHRRRERDVVDERRAGGRAPEDHHRLGRPRAVGHVARAGRRPPAMTPCASRPPTITKRPMKKKIVDHSTRSSASSTSSAATSRSTRGARERRPPPARGGAERGGRSRRSSRARTATERLT